MNPRMQALKFENAAVAEMISPAGLSADDLPKIEAALQRHGALTFTSLPSGLFAASPHGSAASGYKRVWVRDNVYVAYAHHVSGRSSVAGSVARALLTFFHTHRHRLDSIISGQTDPNDVSERPHVRFDGMTSLEIPDQKWSHAQNDALGYFLWLYCELAVEGIVAVDDVARSTLARFPQYLDAIRFWQDEDSGHWEEIRKQSASSIGTVVAGLRALVRLADRQPSIFAGTRVHEVSTALLERGQRVLREILPSECVQRTPLKNRRYDAALLFLLYPLDVVDAGLRDLLLYDCARFLKGERGFRRYLGDSYFAPDYEDRVAEGERTRDYSEDMASRDELLDRIGDEAQWCLFDPILSAYYGRRFLATAHEADADRQAYHFMRALSQITPSWQCPELYYWRRGELVPNPHAPLQWTQANLVIALEAMRATAARRET